MAAASRCWFRLSPAQAESGPLWELRPAADSVTPAQAGVQWISSSDAAQLGSFGASLKTLLPDTWVDFLYAGTETGTEAQPYNTLGEGITAVAETANLNILAGNTTETADITKGMTVNIIDSQTTLGAAPPVASLKGCSLLHSRRKEKPGIGNTQEGRGDDRTSRIKKRPIGTRP